MMTVEIGQVGPSLLPHEKISLKMRRNMELRAVNVNPEL